MPFAWAYSFLPAWLWFPTILTFIAVTVITAHRAGEIHGVVDSKYIVADEFAGLFVTTAFLPFTAKTAVCAFFLFRLADIFKPWPASFFDRKVKNGWGVTLDDVIAGIYARGVMEVLLRMGWLTS